MNDPERWLSAEDAPAGISEMLQDAQNLGPSAAQRAALAAKVGISSSGVWLATSVKTLLLGLAVGGGWLLVDTGATKDPSPFDSMNHAASNTLLPKELEIEVAADHREQPNPSAAPTSTATPEAAVETNTIKPAPPSEAGLIRQARASLEISPQRSLALLKTHERLYPRGILIEEREVLKIRALKRAGKTQAALKQEHEFKNAHPDSAHHLP